jgi:hypothetical protein
MIRELLGLRRPAVAIHLPVAPRRVPLDTYATAIVDPTGRAEITFPTPPVGHRWAVTRATIMGGAVGVEAAWYLWSESPEHLIDVAPTTDSNAVQEVVPFDVPQSTPIIVVLEGLAPGGVVTATIRGEVLA